jgi:hypothetical protein
MAGAGRAEKLFLYSCFPVIAELESDLNSFNQGTYNRDQTIESFQSAIITPQIKLIGYDTALCKARGQTIESNVSMYVESIEFQIEIT